MKYRRDEITCAREIAGDRRDAGEQRAKSLKTGKFILPKDEAPGSTGCQLGEYLNTFNSDFTNTALPSAGFIKKPPGLP